MLELLSALVRRGKESARPVRHRHGSGACEKPSASATMSAHFESVTWPK